MGHFESLRPKNFYYITVALIVYFRVITPVGLDDLNLRIETFVLLLYIVFRKNIEIIGINVSMCHRWFRPRYSICSSYVVGLFCGGTGASDLASLAFVWLSFQIK